MATLTDLKLLHAYLGGLIEQEESGTLQVLGVVHSRERTFLESRDTIVVSVRRKDLPRVCDHDWRRIASGEYECRHCHTITDDIENEQWA
jgi:hypothetical protein